MNLPGLEQSGSALDAFLCFLKLGGGTVVDATRRGGVVHATGVDTMTWVAVCKNMGKTPPNHPICS